jgi:hypothetical protein
MNVAGPTPLSFAGVESPGTSSQVSAGAYKVTESGGPGHPQLLGDVTRTRRPSRSARQDVHADNNDQPATLIVKKAVVNDDGGSKSAQDFSFQVNGGSAVGFEADGQNNLTVDAGTYNVVEPAVAGYGTTYDNCSNLVIPNGGSATCTVTNNDALAVRARSASKSASPTTLKEPGGPVTPVTITNRRRRRDDRQRVDDVR